MRSALLDRTWDMLIVADEAAASLGRELVVELSLRGLRVELDTERGPVLSEALLQGAKVAHHALVLASIEESIRFALLTAQVYPGAPADERAVHVGKVGREAAALIELVMKRVG